MAIPLSTIRQRIGNLTDGPVVLGVPSGVLATESFDVSTLVSYGADYFNDWHGRFYAGIHAGTNFDVTDFSTTGRITFSPPLATAVTTQDKFELYQNIIPSEIDAFINIAIAIVEDEASIRVADESIMVASSTVYEYDVPDNMKTIDRIYMEQATSGVYSAASDPIDYRHWRILPASTPRIWLDSPYVTLTAGRHLRVIGEKSQDELVAETDLLYISSPYVIYQAKALYHESKVGSPGAVDHTAQTIMAQQRADIERTKITTVSMGRPT